MDLGVKDAGINILACLERDPHCCETLRANILKDKEKTQVFEGDIRTVVPKVLMKDLGLVTGQLDLLFGGPPCQAFSQIGKQASLDDERGMLLFELIRFAKCLRPKAILIEQVKGLLNAKNCLGKVGGVFEMLLAELDALGYVPKWRLINAADFGVPQARKRVFIVATLKPNGFNFPNATHQSAITPDLFFPLPVHINAGMAIKGLGRPSQGKTSKRTDSHIDVTPERDIERINGVPEGGHLSAQMHLPKSQRGKLSKKDTTKYLRISTKKPANTLRCGEIFFHPILDRYLTPREYMRIHGYPDTYCLKGPIRSRSGRVASLDQHKQIANSVPPPVANAIVIEILKILKCQKSMKSLATL